MILIEKARDDSVKFISANRVSWCSRAVAISAAVPSSSPLLFQRARVAKFAFSCLEGDTRSKRDIKGIKALLTEITRVIKSEKRI